jgi:hypothetical protein
VLGLVLVLGLANPSLHTSGLNGILADELGLGNPNPNLNPNLNANLNANLNPNLYPNLSSNPNSNSNPNPNSNPYSAGDSLLLLPIRKT